MRRAAKIDRNQPEIVAALPWACQQCGGPFPRKKVSRHQKYCCYACSGVALSASKAREGTACRQCGMVFASFPSQERIFCSYACHLASGGAFRAGLAASEARVKYGAKKDANHNEIFGVLRKLCAVYDISTLGRGLPDGLAWVAGAWHLFDVKNPKTGYGRRGLNEVQKKWIAQWHGGPVYLIYTVDEAVKFARGEFDGLKVVTPDTAAKALAAIGVTA